VPDVTLDLYEGTILGVILALLSSGSAGVIALVVGFVGLVICVSGMVGTSRT